MDSPAQGITSEPVSPLPPPVSSPAVQVPPKKRTFGWVFMILGFVLTFVLGIGFNKYNVASRVLAIRLPKIIIQPAEKPTPSPAATPIPTTSPTANWKTYVSSDMTFQYPPDWTIDGNLIATKSPKITLTVVPKNATLTNECMQQVGAMTMTEYVVKKFIRITTGEACATGDANPRDIWVVPTSTATSPGLSFLYSATEASRAGQLFTQILSTFKFLHGEASPSSTPTASPSAAVYKCPPGEYVDCMPVLTPEKQAACTPEAMAWYKLNCPNFKGGAM
jgi:hypothetical protein